MTCPNPRKKIWDQRYKECPIEPQIPHPYLVRQLHRFKPGTVYDFASGTGRNALFLSQKGFRVSAFDFSEVALDHLKRLSSKAPSNIQTVLVDLSNPAVFNELDPADNIIVIHYKLELQILDLVPALLKENGVFLYCTFNMKHSNKTSFPSKYCLTSEELVQREWELKLLHYCSYYDNTGDQDGYVFMK